jgi:hypothetical protein
MLSCVLLSKTGQRTVRCLKQGLLQMSRQIILGVAIAAILSVGVFSPKPAEADVFDVSYTSAAFIIQAQVNATLDSGNFDVLSFNPGSTVTYVGGATFDITGLVTQPGTPPNIQSLTIAPGTFNYDDVIFTSPVLQWDGNGLLFSANGELFNLYTAAVPNDSLSFTSGEQTLEANDSGIGSISAVPAVPEISSWAMMILGFMGVGFVAYCRKSIGKMPVNSLNW